MAIKIESYLVVKSVKEQKYVTDSYDRKYLYTFDPNDARTFNSVGDIIAFIEKAYKGEDENGYSCDTWGSGDYIIETRIKIIHIEEE